MGVETLHGDCLEVLKGMGDGVVEAVVTDPPYGLSDHSQGDIEKCMMAWLGGEVYEHGKRGFMGKDWDSFVPGPEVWCEVYRVMKPGAFIACFASTRTSDLMSMALRFAGFRKHTDVYFAFGSGFPKATSLSKQIDKQAGVKREIVGQKVVDDIRGGNFVKQESKTHIIDITAPATEAEKHWDGYFYGLQALKPAVEPILLFQKPYDGKAVDSILKHGCGALDIDGCRIKHNEECKPMKAQVGGDKVYGQSGRHEATTELKESGRWPANLILEKDCPEVLACFSNTNPSSGAIRNNNVSFGGASGGIYGKAGAFVGAGHSDIGGSASRFFKQCEITEEDRRIFYTAKASKRERNMGCDGLDDSIGGGMTGTQDQSLLTGSGNIRNNITKNNHCTVKPLSLMQYLVKLISREGQTVLDPFMGSGTTGIACVNLGRNFIGIEREEEYIEIAKARIKYAEEHKAPKQMGLFE